jgi:hypothetical protein
MACITKAKIKGMPRGHRLGSKGPWIEQIFHVVTKSSKIIINKFQFKKPPSGGSLFLKIGETYRLTELLSLKGF